MFKRRLVGGVLLAGLLLGMTGCGDSNESAASVSAESVYENAMSEDISDIRFKKDSTFQEIKGIGDFVKIGDSIYYFQYDSEATSSDAEDASASVNGGEDAKLYRMDVDGTSTFLGDIDVKENEHIYMMFGSDIGHIGIVITDDNSYRLLENDGEVMAEQGDITALFSEEDNIILDMYDTSGGYIVVTDKKIISYELDFIKKSEADIKLGCSCIDKNGNIVVAYNEKPEDSNTAPDKTIISVYDVYSTELINSYEAKFGDVTQISSGSGEYDIYIYADDIYGMKYSDNSQTKLVSLNDSGIVPDDYKRVILADGENLFAAKHEFAGLDEAPKATLQRFTRKSGDAEATVSDAEAAGSEDEQTELTMAVLNGDFSETNIKSLINAYNDSQDKYTIKIIDYSEQGFDNGMIALGKDISEGNIPDLFDVTMDSVGEMSLNQAISKGMLEDITPYMEADESFNSTDIIPSVLEAMKDDGKIYFVAPDFSINCLCTDEKNIGSGYGWTSSEWKDYVMSKPSNYCISAESVNSKAFDSYIRVNLNDYVDWKTGGCLFDSQEFKDLLEGFNRDNSYDSTSSDETTGKDWYELKKNNGEFLMVDTNLYNSDSYVWRKELIGDNMGIKGYPSTSGSGILASFNTQIAMSTGCANKKAAWDFMKFCMSKEVYDQGLISKQKLPVREDSYKEFEQTMKVAKGADEIEIPVRAMTDDEIAEFRDVVDNINGRVSADRKIMEIIREESERYYFGEKTADEACALIQDRVHTYVNESK